MAAALTPPFSVAALVLCAAAFAKLRSPDGAVRALDALGGVARAMGRRHVVRAGATLELALGAWAAAAPGTANALALGLAYMLFAIITTRLALRRAACGCFGEGETPASDLQAALSGALAAVALVAALAPPHGVAWLVAVSPVAVAGTLAAAYATVLAYTQLPPLWSAWSGR